MTDKYTTEDLADVIFDTARANKMSFLLGFAVGGLSEIIEADTRTQEEKQPTIDLLHKLMDGIDELYYRKEES